MLPLGTRIAGRFQIEHIAGRGGMGSVYRAHDPLRGGPVAVKLLHEDQQRAAEIERFSREAELLSELRHPGIVDYVAHGRTPDGQYYLAMEWLEGTDLAALLAGGHHPTVDESISILVQAADAVACAHHRGVVHRDLKPSNLFLVDGRADRLKVLDFGIARTVKPSALTRTGHVLGTPDYMAPEQARGARKLTPAADVFALGCVFYELLAGRPPFAADQLAAVLTRILFEDPEPLTQRLPGLDPRLAGLVEKMLAKDVTQRIPDAVALGLELGRLGATGDTVSIGPTPSSSRGASFIDVGRGLHGVILARGPGPAPKELGPSLAASGARWEWLLDDSLVASVRGYDSAFDLAEQAARVAILIKQHWANAEVVLAVGVDASQKAANLRRGRAASGGGIWLDELAAKLLSRRFELTSEEGAPLLRPGAARVDEDRPLLGRPTACVGREQELGAIEAALAGCIDDSEARAVRVLAGPGLGKSRLRHELLRRIAVRSPEPLVLSGTGELASAGAPYGILRKAVRALAGLEPGMPVEVARERLSTLAGGLAHTACFVGELAGIPFPEDHHPALASARANPQIMQEQIHQAFTALVHALGRQRPIVVVLDDLQWGDALSVALLDHLLRESGAPILVLALARPEIHEVFPRLWHQRRVQDLVLPALSKRASERLLTQVLADRLPPEKLSRLVELSGGNALYLEELARSAAENPDAAVPETVIAMIEARVGRLPADPRQLLFLASVLGRVFTRGDLGALAHVLLGASDDVDGNLERLVQAELIAKSGNDYTFRHALVREATYELLDSDQRQQIHERAAEVLARGPDPDPTLLAEHWQRSSQPARAIPWLLAAAQTAFARCDIPSAMHGVQRALALGPKGTVRGTLRAVEGLCLGYTGQMPIAALDEALELLPNNDAFWCLACHLRLTLAVMTGGWDAVQPLSQRFLAADPTDDAIPEYVTGAGTLATIFVHAGLSTPAHRLRERVEAVAARRPGLPMVETWRVWTDACLLDIDGGPAADVLREVERSCELYRAIANQRNGFFCDGLAALLLADGGNEPAAIARLRQAIMQAEQLNEHYVRAWLSCLLAQILATGPGHLEALAITEALIGLGVAPPCPDLALGVRARALLTAGRVVEAEAPARTALERLAWSPGFAVIPAAALVECLTRLGRGEEAIAIGETWVKNAPPNTSARSKRADLSRALEAARG